MALKKLNAWKVITGAASSSAQVVIQETYDDIESLEACGINLVVGNLLNPHWRTEPVTQSRWWKFKSLRSDSCG
jgi:hypothetical protein